MKSNHNDWITSYFLAYTSEHIRSQNNEREKLTIVEQNKTKSIRLMLFNSIRNISKENSKRIKMNCFRHFSFRFAFVLLWCFYCYNVASFKKLITMKQMQLFSWSDFRVFFRSILCCVAHFVQLLKKSFSKLFFLFCSRINLYRKTETELYFILRFLCLSAFLNFVNFTSFGNVIQLQSTVTKHFYEEIAGPYVLSKW